MRQVILVNEMRWSIPGYLFTSFLHSAMAHGPRDISGGHGKRLFWVLVIVWEFHHQVRNHEKSQYCLSVVLVNSYSSYS
jgi:hypothetical protein